MTDEEIEAQVRAAADGTGVAYDLVACDPSLADPVHHEIEAICAKRAPGRKVVALAGADFYARVKSAHAIVATSEPRLYANIIIRKGVIYPPETRKT